MQRNIFFLLSFFSWLLYCIWLAREVVRQYIDVPSKISVSKRFFLIMFAAIVGNGLGAWNIQTLAEGRYWATGLLTFSAAMVSGTAGRDIARNRWLFVVAWALGSVVGEVGSIYINHRFR